MKRRVEELISPFAFILSIVNDKPINKKVHPAF